MKKKDILILKQEYHDICDKFIDAFEKKHGYEFSYWISDYGGIACFVEQYFFNFDDVVYDIINDCPKGLIFRWQDDGVEHHFKSDDDKKINFKSYCMGLRY